MWHHTNTFGFEAYVSPGRKKRTSCLVFSFSVCLFPMVSLRILGVGGLCLFVRFRVVSISPKRYMLLLILSDVYNHGIVTHGIVVLGKVCGYMYLRLLYSSNMLDKHRSTNTGC
jgi:nitrate reductase NapE component